MKSKVFWILAVIFSLYISLFAFQKINLATADLGRHIINGEILLNPAAFGVTRSALLHTNLFSYTNPDFPFINHHWASGIIAYFVYAWFGFTGLSIGYVACIIGALILCLYAVRKKAHVGVFIATSLFLIPLIADRTEVRPEGLSYFLLAFFLLSLYVYSRREENEQQNSEEASAFLEHCEAVEPNTRKKSADFYPFPKKQMLLRNFVYILPFLEILWVNLHIYFIFGPFLVGCFFLESLIRKNFVKAKKLAWVLGATSIATLINPFGLTLALYPLNIFQNYGYLIVENQSIHFLENLSFHNPSFLWFKITLALIIISSILVLVVEKRKQKTTGQKMFEGFPIALTLISLIFAVLAYLGIRHMTAFALVSLPLLILQFSTLSVSFSNFLGKRIPKETRVVGWVILSIFIVWTSAFHFSNRLPWNSNFGAGLLPNVTNSATFVRETGMHGPIFNNYDIGSYLVFNFFPKEKVFVDNRPEAYPNAFFQQIYVPMQEKDDVWQKELAAKHFNMIYFYRLDMTPWAQTFLIARVKDPTWAPVYVDDYTIIFLRRNDENQPLISKYELPKSMFNVR